MPKYKTRVIELWCLVFKETLGIYQTNAPDDVLTEVISDMRKQANLDLKIDYTPEELEVKITKLGWIFDQADPERYEF